jgi:AcrR family transcriptional regulator
MAETLGLESKEFSVAHRRRRDQLPGGRHGIPPEVVAESQRDRVLKAMTIAAGRGGYRDAHITEVVHRAGVSRRTFYEHFKGGKEECFAAAYARSMEQLWQLTLREFEVADDWADGLRAGLAEMLSALARRPEVASVCFVEVLAAGPVAAERRDEAMRKFLPLFEAAPTEMPRGLRIFEALALGRVADLAAVLHREISARRIEELPDLLPELMYMMVLPFLGPEAAARELERPAPSGAREAAA